MTSVSHAWDSDSAAPMYVKMYETTRGKSFLVGQGTEFKPLVLPAWTVVQGTGTTKPDHPVDARNSSIRIVKAIRFTPALISSEEQRSTPCCCAYYKAP
jgi:hypothetical protein